MWIQQKISILVLLSLAAEGRPIALHNYAPAHEYKSSSYSFSYGVKDPHTGDVKHQWEKKDGDTVRGQYSVLEPDGTVRIVDYTADGKNGFNAVVKHTGVAHHPKTAVSHSVMVHQPVDTHYTTLKESVKTEYHYDDVDNAKQYIFVPDEDGTESIKNHIEVPAPNYLQYQLKKPTHKTEEVKATPKLPIDLNLIKQTTEKIIPIDISQIHPVEIDLDQHTTHELSSEELQNFLRDYYHSNLESLNVPEVETGFKPMRPQVRVPQTYKSGKKPSTTPGLRHYTSKNKNRFRGPSDLRLQRVKNT